MGAGKKGGWTAQLFKVEMAIKLPPNFFAGENRVK
jgi:hypothetical protein